MYVYDHQKGQYLYFCRTPEVISSSAATVALNSLWSCFPKCRPCCQLSADYTKQGFIMNPSRCFVWYSDCGRLSVILLAFD